MRKSVTAIILSSALLMTGANVAVASPQAAAAGGVSASVSTGVRKVIKTSISSKVVKTSINSRVVAKSYRTATGATVVKTGARKVIKTSSKPTKKRTKLSTKVIKSSRRR